MAHGPNLKFSRLARMRFIYNLQSKKRIGKYMLGKIISPDERTLIFAGSIKMAEELESKTYHSKSKDNDFNDFFNEKINRLSAVQSLNEGVNIPNLDNALIVQTTSKERHLIQKIGRIIRHREGHKAKIYLMYAKGTVDEDWVKSATENINMANVKHLKFRV
jgi:superfamily II DNA or RNA helicase